MRFCLFVLVTAAFGQQYRLGEAIAVQPGAKIPAPRQAATAGVAATPSTWYDTSNRTALADAYRNDFLPTRLNPAGWTGSVATGDAGDVTAGYRSAANQRVNWFRAMAGVPAWVTFDAAYNSKAQKAALMIAANNALNHTPPPTWTWYTAEGAEAAGNSNLCQGMESDPGCVAQYIADQGSGNEPVGHRRWILYPNTKLMGTGDVTHNGNLWNALWVIDPNIWGARPNTRDEFVAWPPKGYVPYQVVYPRWSFSYPNADLSSASVTLTRNGTPVAVAVEPVAPNRGDNTIVWVPAGQNTNTIPAPTPPTGDDTYTVTVSNVRINNVARNFTYQVIVFDPQAGVVASPHPLASSMSAAGGTGYLFLNLDPPGASATPVPSASWITILNVSAQATFYRVAANTGQPRSGTITVGGASHTINQGGVGCGFTLNSSTTTVNADYASGQLTLTSTQADCAWTAASDRTWLQVFPLSGIGSGTIYYTIFPNFSSQTRTGTITVGQRLFAVIQQAGVGTTDERFIRLLYFNYFGRLPSQSELAFQLNSGLSRSTLAWNFLNSIEFNNAGRFVAGLYVGLLNRDAEYGGWLFQRNALSTGVTNPDAQVGSFLNGAEFISKNGNLSNADLARLLYRQILGREATPGEVTWREGLLAGGMSRVAFARDLLNSPEFRTGKNARLLAFLLYATLLNRDPGSAEYVMRRDQIAANPSDANVMGIMTDLLNSAEFSGQLN